MTIAAQGRRYAAPVTKKRLDVLMVERGLAETRSHAQALVLVKPQFEAGRKEVGKGGVVRDPEVHKRVVDEIAVQAAAWGARVEGAADSGLPGPKGNREFFLYLRAA